MFSICPWIANQRSRPSAKTFAPYLVMHLLFLDNDFPLIETGLVVHWTSLVEEIKTILAVYVWTISAWFQVMRRGGITFTMPVIDHCCCIVFFPVRSIALVYLLLDCLLLSQSRQHLPALVLVLIGVVISVDNIIMWCEVRNHGAIGDERSHRVILWLFRTDLYFITVHLHANRGALWWVDMRYFLINFDNRQKINFWLQVTIRNVGMLGLHIGPLLRCLV